MSLEFGFLIAFLLVAAILSFDDLVIDFIARFKGLRPEPVEEDELRYWRRRPQKNIAILVANWREEKIIERMLRGNLSRLEYARVWFFVGVYPNDGLTVQAAQRAARGDGRVIVVENHRPGPTTKGQMLNVMFERVFEVEQRIGISFDLFLMHDSEDVLHPQSLLLLNAESRDEKGLLDFLQIPVFSFGREKKQLVGSTYIDEFAELHTKDLLVRDHLQAGLPSAGVGTALSRRLVRGLMDVQEGRVLNEGSLTEDYILGLTSSHMGYRSKFLSRYIQHRSVEGRPTFRDFIATREYFPSEWKKAIRQKGRWIHGIVIQGSRLLPFEGSFARRYFLARDRKGPLTAAVGLFGMVLLFTLIALKMIAPQVFDERLAPILSRSVAQWFFAFNLFAGVMRILNRGYAVWLTQDLATALMSLVRIPVGNVLNFASVLRAFSQDRKARVTGVAPKWTKTVHELPAHFGEFPIDGPLLVTQAPSEENVVRHAQT